VGNAKRPSAWNVLPIVGRAVAVTDSPTNGNSSETPNLRR